MITDAVIEAIDLMAEMVNDRKELAGIMAVREMLCDFSEDDWITMSEKERKLFLEDYLP